MASTSTSNKTWDHFYISRSTYYDGVPRYQVVMVWRDHQLHTSWWEADTHVYTLEEDARRRGQDLQRMHANA